MCVCHSELEGKDVEEVFTAVLRPNNSNDNQLEQGQNTTTAAGNKTHTHHTGTHTLTGTHVQVSLERRWKAWFLYVSSTLATELLASVL